MEQVFQNLFNDTRFDFDTHIGCHYDTSSKTYVTGPVGLQGSVGCTGHTGCTESEDDVKDDTNEQISPYISGIVLHIKIKENHEETLDELMTNLETYKLENPNDYINIKKRCNTYTERGEIKQGFKELYDGTLEKRKSHEDKIAIYDKELKEIAKKMSDCGCRFDGSYYDDDADAYLNNNPDYWTEYPNDCKIDPDWYENIKKYDYGCSIECHENTNIYDWIMDNNTIMKIHEEKWKAYQN